MGKLGIVLSEHIFKSMNLRFMKCRDGSYHCNLKFFVRTIRMSVFCL